MTDWNVALAGDMGYRGSALRHIDFLAVPWHRYDRSHLSPLSTLEACGPGNSFHSD
jgi:hypothetical protein